MVASYRRGTKVDCGDWYAGGGLKYKSIQNLTSSYVISFFFQKPHDSPPCLTTREPETPSPTKIILSLSTIISSIRFYIDRSSLSRLQIIPYATSPSALAVVFSFLACYGSSDHVIIAGTSRIRFLAVGDLGGQSTPPLNPPLAKGAAHIYIVPSSLLEVNNYLHVAHKNS